MSKQIMFKLLNIKNNIFLIIIFVGLIFLLLSLIIFKVMPTQGHFEIDSVTYDIIATNFAQRGLLVDSRNSLNPPLEVVGYPLFLGLIYKFFDNILSVVFIQAILALLCFLLMNKILEILGFKNIFLLAILFLTNLGFLVFTQLLMAEILYVLFLLIFLERFLSKKILQAAFIGGLSVAIKPAMLFFPVLLVPFIFCFFRGKTPSLCHPELVSGSRSRIRVRDDGETHGNDTPFKVSLYFLLAFYFPIFLYSCFNYYNYIGK